MTQAVIYVRISQDRDGTALGTARQEKDCRALCERNGWEVATVLEDNDTSAYSRKQRKAYTALLEGLQAGTWDAVVAWHPDRLHRSPKELEGFIDVIEATGAKVATCMAGAWELGTASGRMTARVVGAVARHESEQKSERIKRKHLELAEAGKPVGGGTRPFGYREDRITVDPVEAALVRDAARQVLDGMTLRSIVRDWNDRGVPTVAGGQWTTTVLRRVLTSPRSAGVREHGGRRYEGTWEPLLDDLTWRRTTTLLLDKNRRVNHAPRSYLLTGGIAVCGPCGKPLVARPRSDKRRSYVCASGPGFHGCGKIRVLADPFEEDVLTAVRSRLDGSPLPTVEVGGVEPVLDEIDRTQAALTELSDDYYTLRAVTREQFQSTSAKLQARLNDLRSRATSIEHAIPVDAVAALVGDDMLRQRAVIKALVEKVVVGPAVRGRNFYDPARVEVVWR